MKFGTLRRYQYKFGLEKRQPITYNREKILEVVEEHFANEFNPDPTKVIFEFLSTKKDPEQLGEKGMYSLRAPGKRVTRLTEGTKSGDL